MKKLHTPNHKLYEQYYVNQARQKGGNLPYRLFKDPEFSKGMAQVPYLKGLFRWAMPHLQQSAKVLGKKALQTGVQVAQDVLGGSNVNTLSAGRKFKWDFLAKL